MAYIKYKHPPMVQMYDKSFERVYTKTHRGFIFSYTDIVRKEVLEDWLILEIVADKKPDKVFFNGVEHKLIEV